MQLCELLKKYEKQGIKLSYTPRKLYVGEVFQEYANATVLSKKPYELFKNKFRILGEYFYNIRISDEEIFYLWQILKTKYKNKEEEYYKTLNAEVFVHVKNLSEKDLAHELWHLIEDEYNVGHVTPIINEAAAIYASNIITRKNINKMGLDARIARELKNTGLKKLLEKDFRKKFQEDILKKEEENIKKRYEECLRIIVKTLK